MATNRRAIQAAVLLAVFVSLAGGCAQITQLTADLKAEAREVWERVKKLRGREPAPPPPAPPVAQVPAPAPEPAAKAPVPAAPAGGVNLAGNCLAKEETGYVENARVTVVDGQVRELNARIDVPRRGSCAYQLAEFTQTQQVPFVELVARSKTACAVRIWQQGDRITVVATDCAEKCTRGAFEYTWPIQFNLAGGCY